ncbi:dienelactone hydrolase family protein [Plantactinospora sp. GCM10030261]|uniref:dienelactone hydrolase family protein n=1 Tax=Plantactinospora sp. GCM10030261 TaxID=3273420 RepID=UPI00360D7B5E
MTPAASSEPTVRRGRRLSVLVAVVSLLLAAAGAVLLARAGTGLAYRQVTVAGVPMTEVVPTDPASPSGGSGAVPPDGGGRPGVVVAHGFAGSSRLMTPIADRLARSGFAVVSLDFTGHGAHRGRLPGAGGDSTDTAALLAADLDSAVRHLRAMPGVDPARIGLVGHSMGAGAVTRYAVSHPDIVATVAISLPDAEDVPDGRGPASAGASGTAGPRSLLLVVGGAEFAGFRAATDEAMSRGGPAGDRRAVVVPGVEHISVLFAARTHDETAAWLARALGPVAPEPAPALVGPATRLSGAGLLLLGFAVGLYPLGVLLLRRRSVRVDPSPVPIARPVLLTIVALPVAAVAAWLVPTHRLPLAVGGYVAVFLAVTGLTLAGSARLADRLTDPPTIRLTGPPAARPASDGAPERTDAGRGLGGGAPPATGSAIVASAVTGIAIVGYAALAVAVPLHLGFTSTAPVGDRWWLLPAVIAGCLLFFAGVDRAVRADPAGLDRAVVGGAERQTVTGPRPRRFILGYVLSCVLTVVGLVVATVVGFAPGFVLLVVPLFALLLTWQVVWAAVLRRLAAPRWVMALTGAVLLGWPIATTLPLTG